MRIMRIILIEGKIMKRKLLIKLLYDSGWKILRHGANHDIFIKNGQLE